MERQLTEGRPFGVLLRYALPVLGGNLFQLFYTLADTVIIGKTLGAGRRTPPYTCARRGKFLYDGRPVS